MYAEEEADELLAAAAGRPTGWLDGAVARRAGGEPLELVVGTVAFAGLRLEVAAGVFVPRTRTTFLARLAVAALEPAQAPGPPGAARLVDLCCGVGAVAAVAATRRTGSEVVAADLDPAAVAVARRNLAPFGARARVVAGDLYDALPPAWRGTVDVLAANAPYVPTDRIAEMPREAREHEPRLALDGGADGAAVQRRVVAGASAWLRPGGVLLVETGAATADALAATFAAAGLRPEVHGDADLDATVVLGRAAPRS